MIDSLGESRRRSIAGGSVSLLGIGLLAIPLFDVWEDVTKQSWSLATTLVENALFFLLSLGLVWGGVWLVRSDWEAGRVTRTARLTVVGTAVIGVLIGWAAVLQWVVLDHLKPVVIGLDGVLIGAVTSFALSVSTTRADTYKQAARQERAINDRLELLYRATSDLAGARSREAAYDIVGDAVAEAVGGSFRVVVDGEPVVTHGDPEAAEPDQSTETVPIGDEGRIELLDGPFDPDEVVTVELFGSYLAEALGRIDREETIRDERDILEFVNRTLRHDLTGDISLVRARLRMIDRNASFDDETHREHLSVALDRVEEMDEFVGTMRTYMRSVLGDDHALEAVALGPVVEEHVESVRATHPDAEVRNEGVPEVAVRADDLLDRVFANLLTNAVEHNDAATPRVVVDGESRGDVVRVLVADNGPGIPEDRRTAIFERGERGTESDGSGFGLYLVKDVVEGYGGDVRVRDNEPRGTVFEVDLPVASGD